MNPTTPEFDYEKKVWGAPDMSAAPTSLGAWHVRHCLRALSAVRGTVLEIGCGAGGMTRTIRKARPDLTVIGLDYSQRSLGIARSLDAAPYVRGDAGALPFANGRFAAVVLFDVLEHLADPAGALIEVGRVLAPGGIFHAYVPMEGNLRSLHGLALRLGYAPKRQHAGHIQQFTDAALRGHLANAGLELIAWRHGAHYVNQLFDLAYFTALAIGRRQVGESLEGVASRNSSRLRGRLLSAAVGLVSSLSFAETAALGRIGGAGIHLTARMAVR